MRYQKLRFLQSVFVAGAIIYLTRHSVRLRMFFLIGSFHKLIFVL